MMSKIRLVVVDDHALFRLGLVGLLADMPELQVVGEAADGKDALELIQRTQPDVALVDVNMPGLNGVEVVRAIRECEHGRSAVSKTHVLMLTISKHSDDLFGAIQAGADGYLLKNVEPEELRKAIMLVAEGKSVLSSEVTRQVFEAVARPPDRAGMRLLSQREMDVLDCMAKGRTTAQIAAELVVSDNTVKTHVRHILKKLNAANRAEAVVKASQLGILLQ